MEYKYRFFDDYSEGAHPQILEALGRTNFSQQEGYGKDEYSEEAIKILRDKVGNPEADIHFVATGSQANLITLSSFMRPYESIIAPVSGHINIHETGALEASGHKIHTIETSDGKITPDGIASVVDFHTDEHMVKPRIVYISQATEVGTIYKKTEIQAISDYCKKNNLFLYVDGARIGSAITSTDSDMNLADLSKLVDAFYIGGTKNGSLLGEAIVINRHPFEENFRYHIKQHGALLAKGRVLTIPFMELFKNDLYFELAKNANATAGKLADGIKDLGYSFLTDSHTNQIFPIFPNALLEKLKTIYGFHVWSKMDANTTAVRLVTSWATKESSVDEFLGDLKDLSA
jgi:threonine aldolase